MKLSVIIPAYINKPENLEALLICLNSLQAYHSRTIDTEFIVSDDTSPLVDLRPLIPPCAARVYRNEQNGGFPVNANAGAAKATGDILFFVNQDVMAFELSQNWDIAVTSPFINDATIGVLGAKLIFPPDSEGKTGLQSAGGILDGHCQPVHRWLGYQNHMLAEYNQFEQVSWVTGAALAIRRELFVKLGGFDTVYAPGYFEDVELCLKTAEQGLKVMYQPQATFIHHVGSTGGSPNFMRNARIFHDRWVAPKKIKPDTSAVMQGWW